MQEIFAYYTRLRFIITKVILSATRYANRALRAGRWCLTAWHGKEFLWEAMIMNLIFISLGYKFRLIVISRLSNKECSLQRPWKKRFIIISSYRDLLSCYPVKWAPGLIRYEHKHIKKLHCNIYVEYYPQWYNVASFIFASVLSHHTLR